MALNKAQLSAVIKQILEDMKTREEDATQEMADRLANAIDIYVRGIQVNSQAIPALSNSGGPVVGTITITNTVN